MYMRYFHRKKLLALLCSLCIAGTFFFASWFVVNTEHRCIGNNCPVCIQIHNYADFLHKFSSALITFFGCVAFLAAVFFTIFLSVGYFDKNKNTLVHQKVRMNN